MINSHREGGRIFIQDVKPIAVPESLDDLAGPNAGWVALPLRVLWSGYCGEFDISLPDHVRTVYRAVLNEGRIDDVTSLINRDLLIQHWSMLMISNEVREAWHSRFAVLAEAYTA